MPKLSSLYHRIVLVALKPSMPRRPRSLSRIIKATGGQPRVLEAGIGVRAGAKQGSLCLSFICPFLHTRCLSQSVEVALAGADSWSDSGFLREADWAALSSQLWPCDREDRWHFSSRGSKKDSASARGLFFPFSVL